MKLKIMKWCRRLYDLLVAIFLSFFFLSKEFRSFYISQNYFIKATVWLMVVLFLYYSAYSWYLVNKRSMFNVVNSKDFEEAESVEQVEEHCDFSTEVKEDEVEG